MPLLLNIDTATEHASICLSKEGVVLGLIESTEQKNHAAFVQPAIQQIINESDYALADIDAVAATSGPGSYTGLRVGLASAKGICYALDKPLILINTLETMAQSILSYYQSTNQPINPLTLLCPLIDARRMEVFTALYNASLQEIEPPHALIIDEHSFAALLEKQPISSVEPAAKSYKESFPAPQQFSPISSTMPPILPSWLIKLIRYNALQTWLTVSRYM